MATHFSPVFILKKPNLLSIYKSINLQNTSRFKDVLFSILTLLQAPERHTVTAMLWHSLHHKSRSHMNIYQSFWSYDMVTICHLSTFIYFNFYLPFISLSCNSFSDFPILSPSMKTFGKVSNFFVFHCKQQFSWSFWLLVT